MENGWVDFRLIKELVSMQMVLEHYGINGLRKSGNELRGACPIHKNEGSRTFQVNINKNVFQCFSCKARGNVLDFVAAIEGCSIRDAALKLQAWFGVGESKPAPTPAQKPPVQRADVPSEEAAGHGPINPPLGFQLRLDSGHEYGTSRGLNRETLEHFGAGFCVSKGTFSGRFVIPLHNEAGELVGYAGRAVGNVEPKYLFPRGAKGFRKSHLVYNLHRLVELGVDTAILVEGFFSVMWLHQAGLPQVVGLLGSELSAEQEGMLCRHFGRVLLLFDGDKAGRTATEACIQRLCRSMWVKAICLDDGVQPDQLPAEQIADLVKPAL
jgi:DNA primase